MRREALPSYLHIVLLLTARNLKDKESKFFLLSLSLSLSLFFLLCLSVCIQLFMSLVMRILHRQLTLRVARTIFQEVLATSCDSNGIHVIVQRNPEESLLCRGRKTYLSECILPGVWDDFKSGHTDFVEDFVEDFDQKTAPRRWIQASLKGRQGAGAVLSKTNFCSDLLHFFIYCYCCIYFVKLFLHVTFISLSIFSCLAGTPPFIVPFGFPRIMSAIACARHVELKRKAGKSTTN